MKQKIMLLAVIIISVLLAACSHFTMNNATVSGRDIVGTRTLTISIAENDYYKSTVAPAIASASARTIVPDAFEDTGLRFYMYGEATNGEKLYPIEITNKVLRGDDGVKGKIKMDMEAYNWDLTLACTDSAVAALSLECNKEDSTTLTPANFNADIRTIEAKAVLIAHTSVDMQYSTNVNFVLTPRGLVNPSTLNFDLYSTGWQLNNPSDDDDGEIDISTGYTITVGIYDFIKGTPVNDATTTPNANGETTVKTITVANFHDSAVSGFAAASSDGNYKIATMTPGTYTFKVTFEQTATGLKSVWSDTIIVLPGVNHRLSIGIPNVIGKLPVAPASFTAKYIKDSEDEEIDYYVAQLDWADSSNNETHFEIDFVELENHTADDNIVTPTDEPSWNTALEYGTSTPKDTETVMIYGVDSPATAKGTGIYAHYTPFAGSALQKEGSLLANNTSVKIRLALGRRYIARIWSVNESGRSTTPAYLAFNDAAFTTGTEYTDDDTGITYGKYTSTTMNRYRVTYYLQDGLWYPRGTKTGAGENPYADEPWTLDQIRYECQEDTTGNAIIAPFGSEAVTTPTPAAAVPLLVRGAFRWYAWNIDVGADATPYDDKVEYAANYPAVDAAIEDYYVTPHNYKGFDNLDLYAAYNNVAGYEIYDDSAYVITDAMIKVDDTALTETQITAKKIIVNKNSASNVVFTLTPPGTGVFVSPFEYEYVRLKITKGNTVKFDETDNHVCYYPAGTDPVTAEVDQSASFTVPVNNLVTGFYPATFTAKYGTTIVSYSFVIEIINE